MKLIKEIIIIFGLYYLGEFISKGLGLAIPGNLIGMLLLLLLLCLKIIKVEQVEHISNFLLDHLSFLFIPAGVGLMVSIHLIAGIWIQILILCLLTTILTMGIVGRIVQSSLKREGSHHE